MDNLLKSFKNIKDNYDEWWQAKGSVLNITILESDNKVEYDNTNWKASADGEEYYRRYHTDEKFNAEENLKRIAEQKLLGDTIPVAMSDYGTVSLASYLGSGVGFGEDTVWYEPCIDEKNIDNILEIDDNNYWWKTHISVLNELKKYEDKFFVGSTAMSCGLDCLYQLMGAEEFLIDLVENPSWVHEKLEQIQKAYFGAFDTIYKLIKREDESMVFGYFSLLGQGKTTQIQSDVSALISPKMFNEYELPYITKICDYMDNTMYHLDGTQAICHLPSVLTIEKLNAVEWSPQAGIEGGGNVRWYDLYEQILLAGKALQVVEASPKETVSLFKHFGKEGINVMTSPMTVQQAEEMLDELSKYR